MKEELYTPGNRPTGSMRTTRLAPVAATSAHMHGFGNEFRPNLPTAADVARLDVDYKNALELSLRADKAALGTAGALKVLTDMPTKDLDDAAKKTLNTQIKAAKADDDAAQKDAKAAADALTTARTALEDAKAGKPLPSTATDETVKEETTGPQS